MTVLCILKGNLLRGRIAGLAGAPGSGVAPGGRDCGGPDVTALRTTAEPDIGSFCLLAAPHE